MKYKTTSNVIHLILTILFFPWALVWFLCAVSTARHNKKVDSMKMQEQTDLLRQLLNKSN